MSNQRIAINGAKWTTVASAINTGVSLIQLAILARLLEPAMFGLVSICNMILGFFHIFANSGFTNSIIYKQEDDRKALSTLFFSSIALGLIIYAVMQGGAFLVAAFYKEPELVKLVSIAALVFPLMTSSQIYWILLQKELHFKSLGIIETVSVLLGCACTITLAFHNYGALSLIYGNILATGIRTISYFIVGLKLFIPMLHFDIVRIKDHLIFGAYHIGQGIIGFFSGNIENIVIGRFIGIKELGYYTIAYQLAVFPITKLNPIILQVTSPIIAKMKDDEGLKRAYLKIVRFISYCNFPLISGLFITAASIVPLVYGQGWDKTVELVRILVFVGFLICITAPVSSLILSKNKPGILFRITVISLFIKLPLLYIGAKYYGLTGIACSYLISALVDTLIEFGYVRKLIGKFLYDLWHNIHLPLLFCLIMISIVAFYQYFIGSGNLIHTVVQIGLGGLVYMALVLKYTISLREILNLKKSL